MAAIRFTARLEQFDEQGEKTGWTYITVPEDLARQLQPDSRKSFRVKGKLDTFDIAAVALLPMKSGAFLLPVNAAMRKGIRKQKGAMVKVELTKDKEGLVIPPEFLECLADEPPARDFFESLKPSQRNYFIKWMAGVKGEVARAKRMAQVINALSIKQDFVAMIRAAKAAREKEG